MEDFNRTDVTFPLFTYTFAAVQEGTSALSIEHLFDDTDVPLLGSRLAPGSSRRRFGIGGCPPGGSTRGT